MTSNSLEPSNMISQFNIQFNRVFLMCGKIISLNFSVFYVRFCQMVMYQLVFVGPRHQLAVGHDALKCREEGHQVQTHGPQHHTGAC